MDMTTTEPKRLKADESVTPLVSVMLVNWNTREMTLDCLRTVFAETTQIPFEVIVVDNGSQDGSAEAIAKEFPQVRLMAERDNHGFALATNISVEEARGKYVLLLNTDTLVLDRAIEKLVAFAERTPTSRIWGGRTWFEDRTLNPASCWQRITPWSVTCMAAGLTFMFKDSALFNPEGYGDWQRDTEREVDVVQGSFFLIEKSFWDELGGFDQDFFMYGEEADLCLRAIARGARPRITPDATIVHFGGASATARANKVIYVLGSRIGVVQRHFRGGWKVYGRLVTLYGAGWRALMYRLASLVKPRLKPIAAEWQKVWRHRDLWKDGPLKTRLEI